MVSLIKKLILNALYCTAFCISACSIQADEPSIVHDESLRSRFLQEYPEASKFLEASIENLLGSGRYVYSLDHYNKSLSDLDEMKWVDFRFFKAGTNVRFDRSVPPEIVSESRRRDTQSFSVVRTDSRSFSVRNAQTDNAQFGILSYEPEVAIKVILGMFWRDFISATHTCIEKPIRELIQESGFQIQKIGWADKDANLVKLVFMALPTISWQATRDGGSVLRSETGLLFGILHGCGSHASCRAFARCTAS